MKTKRRGAAALEKFHFDIVHGCQLRCIGCPNSTLKPKIKFIAPDLFHLCLSHIDVDSIGLMRLFNFGEPLLHPELPAILEQIRDQPWDVGTVEISTNGQYHDFPVLAEAFRTGVLTRLNVSCDGDGTPAEYERLRPPSKWDKFIEFLEVVPDLRDKHCADLVLMTRTICTDPVAQRRWKAILEPRGWNPEFRGWLNLPEAAVNMKGEGPKVPAGVCAYLERGNNLYVDWDGTVVPCCVHPRAGVLGDLKEQTYSEILAGGPRAAMVGAMLTDRRAMNICGQCEF